MRNEKNGTTGRRRSALFAAVAVACLVMTGCAATSTPPGSPSQPGPSHTMSTGETMPGAEHRAHSGEPEATAARTSTGPSEAALMVCEGQVRDSVTAILDLDAPATGTWAWDAPFFTCTYDIDGRALTLTVHDATDPAEGEHHFAHLKAGFTSAEEIEGMAALGMPSFSTPDGIVAFLRDGKTLTVDATALPDGLGQGADRTQEQAAYTLASAVLACWVEHD